MRGQGFRERLEERARSAGLSVPDDLCRRLEAYFHLLVGWNQKMNLVGMDLSVLTDGALDRLLIEPLVAARHAPPLRRLVDVGSGGGSPGIPFALALSPQPALRLVESRSRKSVFLREALRVVALQDAVVETARFEALLTSVEYREVHDLLTVRAVKLDRETLSDLANFLREEGQMFLFGGAARMATAALPSSLRLLSSLSLVPALGSRLEILQKHQRPR